ncbi:hypothetical protein VB145_05670 [Xanthomonas arboricola]|uniref:Uncharacterized protein n=1 Tax=Xanthomonas campestris pv. juglandis TaxID=195709 RepID=A0A8E4EKG5_XANCJ|nr:hypothetical protein [Xanthomonas arboricola]AKU51557.1 hypothetical protein AKJ12_18450 [Xanthomonas arboricola pv. juglandis]KOB03293.1 hypothetical protein AE920_00745 [Xanthomonas arboricola]KOB15554.1 hypothetical protein AE924_11040 [Xanthomonas arboricola]KOB27791.1 hypothetical protein AE927_08300 [Xanthomonas arboricola]KOB37308.1 hypothetical protein AE929_03200 [Xanthomonas arboricola]
MKTQTLRIALSTALFAGTALAGFAQAASLTTLDTVQVRPSADQIAQQALERSSDISTLAAVQVRPSADQRADLVTRNAAASAQSTSGQAAAAIGALMGEVIVNLPVPQLQPSPVELEALVNAAISL